MFEKFIAEAKQFKDKLLKSAKPSQTRVKVEVPPPENIQRIPDHIDELVTALRYMLARTDPNGRQCECSGNTEVDRMIRAQFEQILTMIVDDRVQTALRNSKAAAKSQTSATAKPAAAVSS